MLARIAAQLEIPAVGLADYNPHGLALLQTYRRGGARTSLEAGGVNTDVKWLGLRSSHIGGMPWVGAGEPLTARDRALARSLKQQHHVAHGPRLLEEVEKMEATGKHELQCLYGHPQGIRYLSDTFLPTALLQHDI
jgi:DNA topoisomerase VI subunit A